LPHVSRETDGKDYRVVPFSDRSLSTSQRKFNVAGEKNKMPIDDTGWGGAFVFLRSLGTAERGAPHERGLSYLARSANQIPKVPKNERR